MSSVDKTRLLVFQDSSFYYFFWLSLIEIKQAILDCLRDIVYDIISETMREVEGVYGWHLPAGEINYDPYLHKSSDVFLCILCIYQ